MAITFENVHKTYRLGKRTITVLRGADMVIAQGARVAILAPPGSGKSTLMRLIAGTEPVTSGRIVRDLRTSWVIPGYSFFSHYGTGVANAHFVARYFGVNEAAYLRAVTDFSELGLKMNDQLDRLPGIFKGQLAIAMALCMDTDVYLFDDSIGFGSDAFRGKCADAIQKLAGRGKAIVIATSTTSIVTPFCTEAYVIEDARMVHHPDLADGIEHLTTLLKPGDSAGAQVAAPAFDASIGAVEDMT